MILKTQVVDTNSDSNTSYDCDGKNMHDNNYYDTGIEIISHSIAQP